MNARNQCELRTKRTDKLFEEKRVNMRELDLSIQQVLERRHRNGEDKLPPGETAETKKQKITVETRQSVGSRIQRTRHVKTLLVDINVGYSPAKKLTTKSITREKTQ